MDYKLFWYLFLSALNNFSITSSASSLIMISMLSLFECITRSSSWSLEEIKLFAIANWIFHVSDLWDYLWCLLNMIYFLNMFLKWQCFISVTFTFILNVIATWKNTYSYWFIIIFFSFILKNISSISKYYILN